jgi:hypothetical protein
MNHRFEHVAALLAATLILALPNMAKAADVSGASFVAGLAPYQRPQGAPAISAVSHDAAWRTRALTGISEPVPASLRFLDNQGAWYTPFNNPGGPGYYDLRQWFGGAAQTTVKQAR